MGFYRDFRFTVYGVVRASDRLLLYIGQTSKDVKLRLKGHRVKANQHATPKTKWHQWLRDNPTEELDVVVLGNGEGVSVEAHEKEREFIHAYTCAGAVLLNSNNGMPLPLRTCEPKCAPTPILRLKGPSLLTVF